MPKTGTQPRPGDLWLSRPPNLMVARIVAVDRRTDPGVVSYELQGDDGLLPECVNHASLDDGWWQTFQPLTRRFG